MIQKIMFRGFYKLFFSIIILGVSSCMPMGSSGALFWGTAARSYNQSRTNNNYIVSRIKGTFRGFSRGREYELLNGQTWVQTEYYSRYGYAYSPEVILFIDNGQIRMFVDGIDYPVIVTRIK